MDEQAGWGRRVTVVVIGVLVTLLYLYGAYVAYVVFLMENCFEGDGVAPAIASAQGFVCGGEERSDLVTPAFAIFVGVSVAALSAMWWLLARASSWRAQLGAALLPVGLLAVAWVALALPSDECDDDERRSGNPQCARE